MEGQYTELISSVRLLPRRQCLPCVSDFAFCHVVQVYILQPMSLPLDFVLRDGAWWEKEQEANCVYVALTRGKQARPKPF